MKTLTLPTGKTKHTALYETVNKLIERVEVLEGKTPKTIKLEDSNFKIDSENWTKKKDLLENPKGDVWEILKGEFAGEQLFTWDAAMRETKKAGKRLPTSDEFVKLYTDVIPDLPKAGSRGHSYGTLNLQSAGGYYWSSSSVSGANASYLNFNASGVYPALTSSRAYGFSVRCVQD